MKKRKFKLKPKLKPIVASSTAAITAAEKERTEDEPETSQRHRFGCFRLPSDCHIKGVMKWNPTE